MRLKLVRQQESEIARKLARDRNEYLTQTLQLENSLRARQEYEELQAQKALLLAKRAEFEKKLEEERKNAEILQAEQEFQRLEKKRIRMEQAAASRQRGIDALSAQARDQADKLASQLRQTQARIDIKTREEVRAKGTRERAKFEATRKTFDLEAALKEKPSKIKDKFETNSRVAVFVEEVVDLVAEEPLPAPQMTKPTVDIAEQARRAEERGKAALAKIAEAKKKKAEEENKLKQEEQKRLDEVEKARQNPQPLCFGQARKSGKEIANCVSLQVQKKAELFDQPSDYPTRLQNESVPLEYSMTSVESEVRRALAQSSHILQASVADSHLIERKISPIQKHRRNEKSIQTDDEKEENNDEEIEESELDLEAFLKEQEDFLHQVTADKRKLDKDIESDPEENPRETIQPQNQLIKPKSSPPVDQNKATVPIKSFLQAPPDFSFQKSTEREVRPAKKSEYISISEEKDNEKDDSFSEDEDVTKKKMVKKSSKKVRFADSEISDRDIKNQNFEPEKEEQTEESKYSKESKAAKLEEAKRLRQKRMAYKSPKP